jgi:hypothetical protein
MRWKPPLPKEHGSWAMFIVPLLVGFIVAPVWQARGWVLVVAALGFFLVRYPLALLVKTRHRPRRDRPVLWRWTILYAGLAGLGGGWLVVTYRLGWLVILGLAAGLLVLFHLWLVARRQEMSVAGELAGIVGLALGAPLAYYTVSGQLDSTAALLWLVNALYFGGTVFYIKLKVRGQPREAAPRQSAQRFAKAKACLIYQMTALTILMLLAFWQLAPNLTPLALVPATLKTLWGAWHWQDRKSLKMLRLGVIEIIHSIAFAGLMIIIF